MASVARFGLAARAFVYIVTGWLAVQIARGHTRQEANQRGAVAEIAGHPYGTAVLWLLGLGFAAYALWRLSEATYGTATDGKKTGPRVKSLARGTVYGAFAVMTFAFIAGDAGQSQTQEQVSWTARLMKHESGRWLVGVVGIVVVLVGIGMIVDGLRKRFLKELRMRELTGPTRRVVVRLGLIGNIARGIVFAVAGILVINAAVTFDARKSTGLDGALRTLANREYGPWLLGALAVGLIAFGLYGFAAARWART
jgi:hypothetical protein